MINIKCPTGLNNLEKDTLWQMFRYGPTWDGDLCSKSGRDGLVQRGYAGRFDGWNWLTDDGARLACELGFGARKEADNRRQRYLRGGE